MSRVLLASAIWGLAMSASAAPYAPKVGEPHADFVLPAVDGRRPVSLAQVRGRKVLLVHFASW